MKPDDSSRPAHERRDAVIEKIVRRRIRERDRGKPKPKRKATPKGRASR